MLGAKRPKKSRSCRAALAYHFVGVNKMIADDQFRGVENDHHMEVILAMVAILAMLLSGFAHHLRAL